MFKLALAVLAINLWIHMSLGLSSLLWQNVFAIGGSLIIFILYGLTIPQRSV